jgi:hypothetical protein
MLTVKKKSTHWFSLFAVCLDDSDHEKLLSCVSHDSEGRTFSLHLNFTNGTAVHKDGLTKEEILPEIRTALLDNRYEEGVHESEIIRYIGWLNESAEAIRHDNRERRLKFMADFTPPEHLRQIAELAPVCPPEYLARVVPQMPLVTEAAELIGNWYLFLSQMLREEVKGKMNPGVLDDYLQRLLKFQKLKDQILKC